MAENLNYADSVTTPSLKGRSWCYDNVEKNCDEAGRLYTWAAAIDSVTLYNGGEGVDCGYGKTCTLPAKVQGICDNGWHLPTKAEWQTLITAVGGSSTAGKALKSQTGWDDNGNGTDAYGFSALPAGYRGSGGGFSSEGIIADFWSASEYDDNYAHYRSLYHDNNLANLGDNRKYLGFSVRCVKDSE